MKLKSIFCILFLTYVLIGKVGILIAQSETFPIWPNQIPNAIENVDYKEVEEIKDGKLIRVSKVSIPTLSVFLPDENNSNGTTIVICPGGGYSHLAMEKEGFKVAQWLNTLGITAFVLKYRLPSDEIMENKSIGPLQDAQEAIRLVRKNALKWDINPEKIGIMGFSAGGHLASTVSTHYDNEVYPHEDISAKPNFSILIYPVISMDDKTTHKGSKTNLLGDSPSQEFIEKFSNEKQIDTLSPPTFIIHATDDKAVLAENSINYYLALKTNNVPAELHLYEKGGHGFGLGVNFTSLYWTVQCEQWLKANHF